MTIDEFIQSASDANITKAMMDYFANANRISVPEALDRVAKRIIRQYDERLWEFEFCDAVANSLYLVILIEYGGVQSDLAWQMFLGFDEGEYHHEGDPEDKSPEELYTRPFIRELAAKTQ